MSDGSYTPKKALEQIWGYLEELHSKKEYAAENMIRAFYQGIYGPIKLMIYAHEKGVMVSVNPVVERPEDGWGKSVRELIRTLDSQGHMVRIGQDEDGDIYVKVDLPSNEVIFGEFVNVFLSLCRISEDLLVPIWQAHAYDRMS